MTDWDALILRLVSPVESGGRGMRPADVSALTFYQLQLFSQIPEKFEQQRSFSSSTDSLSFDSNQDGEVRAEMRLTRHTHLFPQAAEGPLALENFKAHMKQLRTKFTGSESL